jgi:hypothetical protein
MAQRSDEQGWCITTLNWSYFPAGVKWGALQSTAYLTSSCCGIVYPLYSPGPNFATLQGMLSRIISNFPYISAASTVREQSLGL